MPQLRFAPDMCIFLLASFFMTLEVLACFSDSEFPFYVFYLHWKVCFSNGENTCNEHQNINEFPYAY